MTHRLGLRCWAAGAMALVAVAACSSDADPKPAPSTPSVVTSSPTSETTSASPPSPSDQAAAAAAGTARNYYATLDRLGQDTSAPISELRKVAAGTALSSQQRFVRKQRDNGNKQIGNVKLADVTVQSVNLDNSDPSAGKVPTAVVDVCWDVTSVDVVDSHGKSVVLPTRPDGGRTRLTIVNRNWAANPSHGWRVESAEDQELKPCAAS